MCVRMTARNVFYRLVDVFKPLYNNYRDDHAILRLLSRSPGVIWAENGRIEIQLWPCAQLRPDIRRTVCQFLDQMSCRINEQFAGRFLPIRLSLITSDEIRLMP